MFSYINCDFIRFFVISRKYIKNFRRYPCLKLNSVKTDRLFFVRLVFLNCWHVSTMERTIRPFALENINKSVWALGLKCLRQARTTDFPDAWRAVYRLFYYFPISKFQLTIFNIILKVIYHPLYGMSNYVLIWGDWLSPQVTTGHMIANHPI